MDPDACIDRASRALAAYNYEEARDALNDYNDWIVGGGFPAKCGAFHVSMIAKTVEKDAKNYAKGVKFAKGLIKAWGTTTASVVVASFPDGMDKCFAFFAGYHETMKAWNPDYLGKEGAP